MKASKRILVVDDDPVISRSFERVLEPKGYAVIAASSGGEALEKIRREDYDAVYTDIRMPGMNGIEVARRIKENRPWLPVVIVTAYGSEENEGAAHDAGVSGFLRKPLSPEAIESSAEDLAVEPFLPFEPAAPAAKPRTAAAAGRFAWNAALFVAAPFIGLVYVLGAPFLALWALAWLGYKALRSKGKGN